MCTKIPEIPPGNDDRPALVPAVLSAQNKLQVQQMLAAHLLTKHSAWQQHEAALKAQADLRRKGTKAIHGHVRHGYQTGWLGQLVRIVTHRPPDQTNDPMGVAPVIKTWHARRDHDIVRKGSPTVHVGKGAALTIDKKGYTVAGNTPAGRLKVEKSGGKSAGVFYSPTAQQDGIANCTAVANTLAEWAECEVRLLSGALRWVPFTFLYVECTGRAGGYGVAYERTGNFSDRREDEVLEAVDDFLRWQTRGDYARRNPNGPALTEKEAKAYRFARWDDLLTFLGVVQLPRNGVHAEFQREAAKVTLMTIFPVTVAPGAEGWAPGGLVFDKAEKAAFDKCVWTGGLKRQNGTTQRITPPAWSLE